jgi:hypothetical protein
MSRALVSYWRRLARFWAPQAAKMPADYDPLTDNGRDFARALAFDSSDRCDKDASRFSSLDRVTVALRYSVRALSKSFCRPSC